MDSEFSRKKLLVFGTLLLVVIAIPVTLYSALNLNSKNETRSQAAVSEDTVIVIINGIKYKKSDIRKIAEEQNDPSSVDQQALANALDTLIERKILDKASSDLKIVPQQARILKYKIEGLTDNEAKYEALREQVILKVVNSVEIETIGFWNPPTVALAKLSADEQAAAKSQLSAGIPALDTIELRMNDGDNLFEIADSIITLKPELAPVLAVNGYIAEPLSQADREFAIQSYVEEYGDTAFDKQMRDAVFNTAKNSVKKITNTPENRGGIVVKVINKGDLNGFGSYDAWLTKQKASSVVKVNSL